VRSTVLLVILHCQLGWFLPCAAGQAIHVQGPRPRAATAVSSLTLTATPSFVNFNLVAHGVAAGSGPIQITTRWGGSLCIWTCTIRVYGYFPNATSALSGGSPRISIPSNEVLGRVTGGSAPTFTPFSGASPFGGAGAGLLLSSRNFFFLTFGGSQTDSLDLEINLANQPSLPAGTYSGVLYLQAQSF
jgi:hypothetical protein